MKIGWKQIPVQPHKTPSPISNLKADILQSGMENESSMIITKARMDQLHILPHSQCAYLSLKTYQEAMQSPHAQQWKEAMAKEVASLIANKTWVLKPLHEGRKAVKCKWIYKVKYKLSEEVEQFKARLVAKGFSQVVGVDPLKLMPLSSNMMPSAPFS
jgi:hypothetical protein